MIQFDLLQCGAGGSRTLVQTYSPKAFYMLIAALIFENRQGLSKPTGSVSAVFSFTPHGEEINYPVFFLIGPGGLATDKPAIP